MICSPLAAQVPLGRVAELKEIAAAPAILASDDSSFVNGIGVLVEAEGAELLPRE